MSPIPFLDPDPNSAAGIHRLRDTLLRSGLATGESIVGCSAAEVAEVQAAAGFPLPDDYLDFLRIMGRRAGRIMQGEAVFYPQCLEAAEAAADIAGEPGENLNLDGRFFFAHHQGYRVSFFEKESPAVFLYTEHHPDLVEKVAERFLEFVWRYFDWQVQLEEKEVRSHEIRQQKREAMGLPREEFVPLWKRMRQV